MIPRGGLVALALLAGCAAPVTQGVTSGTATPDASAAYQAQRAGLQHIGMRDCKGYRLNLYAPTRLNAATISQGSLFLRAYVYAPGGPIQMRLPANGARLQQRSGVSWQDLPMTASAGRATASGGVAATPIQQQLGQTTPLPAGEYRLWSGQFSAQRSGGSVCAMSPLWRFSVE